jgi:hypothetical protein
VEFDRCASEHHGEARGDFRDVHEIITSSETELWQPKENHNFMELIYPVKIDQLI